MRINNKGQMGPLGEDMAYMIIIVLAIAAILIVVVNAFADHTIKYAKLDAYRSALITADKVSTQLAWETPDGVKRSRILDAEELNNKLKGGSCKDLCVNCAGICVLDEKEESTKIMWFCGDPACNKNSPVETDLVSAAIKLPVSIRINRNEFHPGLLEVTVGQ